MCVWRIHHTRTYQYRQQSRIQDVLLSGQKVVVLSDHQAGGGPFLLSVISLSGAAIGFVPRDCLMLGDLRALSCTAPSG